MVHHLAGQVAHLIMSTFTAYREQYRHLTRQARGLFEAANWRGIQAVGAQRIDLYEQMAQRGAAQVLAAIGDSASVDSLWRDAKRIYSDLLVVRSDFELAETFYNSIYGRLLGTLSLTPENMFIKSSRPHQEVVSGDRIYRHYDLKHGLVAMLGRLLDDFAFQIPWENKRRDIRNIVDYALRNIAVSPFEIENAVIEVVKPVFFRNKAAYLIGRARFGSRQTPFVLPVLHSEQGSVYVDTLITNPDDVSVIFSFTRSYFLVDVNVPSEFIRFLKSLIPAKSIAELYNSIGFYKQGKAEFYRSFVEHLENSIDQFVSAPGVKGMVMTVFTLPSFPVVFKVIRDRFSVVKQITPAKVKAQYQLVKRHDRVGRMADTQEFTNLCFPRARFSEQLIEALLCEASSAVSVTDSKVVIRHLWIERRMTPLNLYIEEALQVSDKEKLFHAINEYGKAIKQLAAANIFAGDMLFKNFGVTRHGRVVFYDYDEIAYLTECNFRKIPEPLYPEQELSGEPWYSVGPNDVFPEEFSILTSCNAEVRRLFNELHADLLDVRFWQQMQSRVEHGEIVDVFPYRQIYRFDRNRSMRVSKKSVFDD